MADYKLKSYDESEGVIRQIDNADIPNSSSNPDWQNYLAWKALGNTPDPVFTIEEAKAMARNNVVGQYEANLDRYIAFAGEEVDLKFKSREKILNARASSKATKKVRKTDGRAINLTDEDLSDLIDEIDDRDDYDLDQLDLTLDAIDAAETIEDLEPYLPPLI